MTSDDKVLAWHFLTDDGRMRYGRRPRVKVGKDGAQVEMKLRWEKTA